MILSFGDQATEDVFNGIDTQRARRTCPPSLWPVVSAKLDQLNAAVSLAGLRLPPGNRLEPLLGDRRGQHSIRVNQKYRICFTWTAEGPAFVEIVDYH